jgi:hypothetical protein
VLRSFAMLARLRDALRSGDWLNEERRRLVAVVLAVVYAASFAYILSSGPRFDPRGRPIGADFAAFFGASRELLRGTPAAALYRPDVLNAAIRDLTGGGQYVWLYPPTALLFYWPVASLPYLAALAAWILVGLLAYLAAVWRAFPSRSAIVAAIVFPAVFACATHGHNGLLLAGLLGGGLLQMSARPGLAGVLLAGAAALKPHLASLVPVALIAGRRWRALASMAGAAAILASVVTLAFGVDVWSAFLRSSAISRWMLETGAVPYDKIASVFSAARLLGCGVPASYGVQAVATLGAVGVTVWAWTRPFSDELKATTLLLAAALATPYVYDYDLPALGVGLALWARSVVRAGWAPWERSVMFAVWLSPLLARPIASAVKLGVVPLVVAVAVAVVLRRGTAARGAGCIPARA